MKIKSERFQSIYIISCDGPALTPATATVFLKAMRGMIEKGRLHVLFDLENINFVVGAQLALIYQAVAAIEGRGELVFCGVKERDLKLISITHPDLAANYVRASDRNEALDELYWEKSEAPKLLLPDENLAAPEAEVPVKTGTDEEEEFELIFDLVEDGEIEEADQVATMDQDGTAGGQLPLDTGFDGVDMRRFARVRSRRIMDRDFHVFCKSKVNGKHFIGVVSDIGLGGLLMSLSPPKIADKEELIIEGRLGRDFKFKEEATFIDRRGDQFVFEFVKLSERTTRFMETLMASLNIRLSQYH